MSLILKQEPANTIATPPAGKSTLFVTDTSTMAVKAPDGNVTTFPTVQGANTQLFFNDNGAINGNANLVFDKNTSVMTLLGNIEVTNVLTDNLLYANGNPWDLQQPAGSNTAIQFNDNDSFGGSSAFTFDNVTNAVTATGTIYASNIGGGNTVTANFFSGTLTTGNQPNITTIGTLGNLTVTSNVSAGNIKTNNLLYANGTPWDLQQAAGSNTQVQFNNNNDFGATANFAYDDANSVLTVTGNIVAINTLHAGNVSGGNLVTANFVNVSSNLVATNIYANSGTVGASLLTGTLTTGTQPNITSVGNLTSLTVNGIITANQITAGNTTANSQVLFNDGNIITGSTGLTFDIVTSALTLNGTLNSGNANLGNYAAANYLGGTLTTASNAQPNITSVGSLTSLTVNGGANVYTLTANGNISAGNVSGGNAVSANFLTGTLTTAAQPNITSVGTLSSLTVSGNASAGNIGGGNVVSANYLTGTLTTSSQPNITDVGTLTSLTVSGNLAAGNVGGGNLVSANFITGTLTTAAQPNITSTGTLSSLTVTGNITGGNLKTGGLVDATGNVSGGNITTGGVVSATGNVTGGNLTTAGALSVTGNANVGNLGTDGLIVATGNITGGNLVTAGALSVTGNATVGNLTAGSGSGGSITGANLVSANYITGTLTTAAQPNITSLGTLSTLTVSGNANVGNIGATTFVGALSGAATTAGTVTTAAQPNITSVGTLTSLTVTGTTTAGNLSTGGTLSVTGNSNVSNLGASGLIIVTGNVTGGNLVTDGAVVATGNVSGGNLTTGGALSVTGNANIGNIGTAGLVVATGNVTGGNLTTGGAVVATGNVSGGNLTTAGVISVTGNANVGNLGTAGLITATGNVSGGNLTTGGLVNATGNIVTSANLVTDLIVGRTSGISIVATGTNQDIELRPTGLGSVDVGNFRISNVATPTQASDAATKDYVDTTAQGLHVHDSVTYATTTTLAVATGGTVTYNNGASGVGANLVTTGTFLLIDGGNVQTVGTRIMVKNEANAAWNGIYTYANTTTIVRATDFDSSAEAAGGDFFFVTSGSTQADTGWVQTTDNPTIGTSNIVFTQFAGQGTYTAGTGLALNGTQFYIANTTVTAGSYGNGDAVATFTVNGQGQLSAAANVAITANAANLSGTTLKSTVVTSSLTSVGTLTSLAVTGNATAGNVYANSGTIGASLLTGTLTTAAQPNITSVGTLSSVTVTANVTAGNLVTGGALSVTGNATFGNIISSGTGGNISGANVISANTFVSNVTTGTAPLTVTSTTRVANLNVAYANVADFTNVTTQTSGNGYLILANALTGNIAETANASFVANTSNGALYASSFVASAYNVSGVTTGITAAGSTQGTATALTTSFNVVSTVAASTGVVFPTAVAGMRILVINLGANALAVYPASGGAINSIATNGAYSLAVGARLEFIATSTTQWYTLSATYA